MSNSLATSQRLNVLGGGGSSSLLKNIQLDRLDCIAIKNLQGSMRLLQNNVGNLDKEVDELKSFEKEQDLINEIYGANIVRFYFATQNLAISTLKLNELSVELLPITSSYPDNYTGAPVLITSTGPVRPNIAFGPSPAYPLYLSDPDHPIQQVYIVKPSIANIIDGIQKEPGILYEVEDSPTYDEMLLLSTYISVRVASNKENVLDPLLNLEGVYTGLNANWFGFNELYPKYATNVPGYNQNSGQDASFRGITLSQDIVNAIGSSSTCSGAAWILSSFFGSPKTSNLPYPTEDKEYAGKPYTGTDNDNHLLLTLITNNSDETCPYFAAENFSLIENVNNRLTTYAERFLEWAGFDEMHPDAGFTNITTPSLINKLNIYLGLIKLFRYEKLMQYGLFQLPVNEVANLAFNTAKVNPLSTYGHPTYYEMMDNFKNLSKELLGAVGDDIKRISEVLPVNFSDALQAPGYHNLMGFQMRIYFFHFFDQLLMAGANKTWNSTILLNGNRKQVGLPQSTNELTLDNINNFKNMIIPLYNKNTGQLVDHPLILDFTDINNQLSERLESKPLIKSLENYMKNIYFTSWNGNIIPNYKSTLWNHPFANALINMYDYLFEQLEGPFVMTPDEFWSHTRAVEIMSVLFNKNNSYRGTIYTNSGILAAPLLDTDQVGVLQQTCNLINYKILSDINNKVDAADMNINEYQFFGTFSIFGPYLYSEAFSGNYKDFVEQAEKANVSLPSDQACPCF